jgi:four helix bundle protein
LAEKRKRKKGLDDDENIRNDMGTVRSYKDLIAWQKSMDLAEAVYVCTGTLPKQEAYGLVSQMRRASVSIAANIAEGHGRNSTGEYRQFLGVAKGSLAELETEIVLAERVGLVPEKVAGELQKRCEETSKILAGLHKAVSDR